MVLQQLACSYCDKEFGRGSIVCFDINLASLNIKFHRFYGNYIKTWKRKYCSSVPYHASMHFIQRTWTSVFHFMSSITWLQHQ